MPSRKVERGSPCSLPLLLFRKRRPTPSTSARSECVFVEKSTLRSERHLPQTPSAIVCHATHSFLLPWLQSLCMSSIVLLSCTLLFSPLALLLHLPLTLLLQCAPAPVMHSDVGTRPNSLPRSRRLDLCPRLQPLHHAAIRQKVLTRTQCKVAHLCQPQPWVVSAWPAPQLHPLRSLSGHHPQRTCQVRRSLAGSWMTMLL